MKFFPILIFATLTVLSNTSAYAAAKCGTESESVVIHDFRGITVTGLSDKGVLDGIYNCDTLLGFGPGFMSTHSSVKCHRNNNRNDAVVTVMSESVNFFGVRSASVGLYKNNTLVFQSSCNRM